MTGLGLVVVGGRLVWWAGTVALAAGALLMTVLGTAPAAPSVSFEPRSGGVGARTVVGF